MKRRCILIIVLLILGGQEQFVPGQKTSTECLSMIDRSFQKVSTEKAMLYEVNSDYFLQAEFQKSCEVSRIDVSPRYFWDYLNPEWKEPGHLVTLSDDQFTQVLSKIDQIKPLGSLVQRGQTGVVTNATLRLLDRYEKGFVERRLYDSVGELGRAKKVTSFSVYFIRSVDGKVSDKKLSRFSTADKRATLKINGRWYWVDEEEYRKAVVGARGVFMAAGPIS